MMEGKHSEEIAAIHRELVESRQKLAEKEAFISDLLKKCDRLAKSDGEHQERIGELHKECDQLRSQVAKESATSNKDNEALKKKLATLEREVTNLKKEKEMIEQTATSQSNEVNELKHSATVLQTKNKQLELEKQQLKAELATRRIELRVKEETIKTLNNKVVDLKGRIRVVVRVRPPLGEERGVPITHISYPAVSSIKLDQGTSSQTYNFFSVFGPNVTQERVFADVEELILSCLHGYNVSIIAYGATGSGKTFTMRGGDGASAGIIPRAVRFLLRSRDELSESDWVYNIKASFLEVHNEEIYDLLANRNKLEVKIGSGVTVVTGMKQLGIVNEEETANILAVADRTRSTASTKSRSHAIFAFAIHGKNEKTGGCRSATLHLVDFAGSKRVKESGAEGDRFRETTYINSSLLILQECVRSQLRKNTHIPYRDSKLTMLLRDSLGAGNSKTLVIVTLNPAVTQAGETKRSLEFAQQMSVTKIGYAKKQEQ